VTGESKERAKDDVLRATVIVGNVRGIHARAAAKIVKLAGTFDARVTVTKDGETVGADSILGLLMLAATPGTTLELAASGRDAPKAMEAMVSLLSRGDMGEI
jgi:phosphocarrier protein HPr